MTLTEFGDAIIFVYCLLSLYAICDLKRKNRQLQKNICLTYVSDISSAGHCLLAAARAEKLYNLRKKHLKHHWSNILVIRMNDPKKSEKSGHAITIFEHNDVLYSYDIVFGGSIISSDLSLKNNAAHLSWLWQTRNCVYNKVYHDEAFFVNDYETVKKYA